jgi:hypothetical protein
MSATYGPIIFSGTGKILQINISQATVAMIVENQSLNDVLFSVSVSQPQLITQAIAAANIAAGIAITSGGWDLHIGPRQAGILQIPSDALIDSPQGRYWTGVVWCQQVNITNALVTSGSFVSNPGPNVWVTAYGPGEKVPDAGLTSIGYFLASQERQVSVPISPIVIQIGEITSGVGTWDNIDNPFNIGNYPFSNAAITAGLATSGSLGILLYRFHAVMLPLSAGAAVAESQQVQARVAVLDHTSAIVATTLIFDGYFAHLSHQSVALIVSEPPFPVASFITVPAGAGPPYSVVAQGHVFNPFGGGGTNIKTMDYEVEFDIAGAVPTGASGGIAGTPAGSVYTGFVF